MVKSLQKNFSVQGFCILKLHMSIWILSENKKLSFTGQEENEMSSVHKLSTPI